MRVINMLTKQEKLISYLDRLPIVDVRTAWINRVRAEHEREDRVESDLVESGMERVECDGPLMPDGREVMRVRGRAYALRPEVHAERLAQRFEAARQRQTEQETKEPETKSVVGTESLSAMICPVCGDSLQHTSVCPKCSAGQRGYKHRYACACGAIEIISQEAL